MESQSKFLKRLRLVFIGICLLVSLAVSYFYMSRNTMVQRYTPLITRFGEPNETSAHNTLIANESDYYVTFSDFTDGRGLGNQMFTFAAVVYVAELTEREIIIPRAHKAKRLFEVFEMKVKREQIICPCYTFSEKLISYDERINVMITDTTVMTKNSLVLRGYFQSWKYLTLVNERIRQIFRFKQRYTDFATEMFKSNSHFGWKSDFIRVGIHNRRGDFALAAKSSGYSTAPESYFRNAMKYFTDRYEQVQFFVASQDKLWTMQHIVSDNTSANVNVVYLFDNAPGEDMAVLSMCDHVIVSSGTFGWWAAWLAQGTTIYYAKYPYPHSSLDLAMKNADYYPPHWISME